MGDFCFGRVKKSYHTLYSVHVTSSEGTLQRHSIAKEKKDKWSSKCCTA